MDIINNDQHDSQTSEHTLGIFASMLRSLPGDSAPRIRLLGKFVEKDYEKVNKIVKLRREYATRLAAVDREIRNERAEVAVIEQKDHVDEWLSRRLDAGLSSLQVSTSPAEYLVASLPNHRKRLSMSSSPG